MSIMNLLDQLLQSGQGALQNAGNRGNATAQGNPLGSLLTGAGGGALAAGTIGVLMGSKKARKMGGAALKYGGLAALGLVAYKAFSTWQQNNASTTQVQQPRTLDRIPAPEAEFHGKAVLRAIIAAAKADGHIDDRERQLIDQSIAQLTSDLELQSWVDQELRKPMDPAEIATSATTPEIAAEMYLASLLMVDEENFMERAYLDELARKMNLDPSFKMELERQAKLAHG
ncbi:MAG: DUF533 domain-containing protein [Deltaproteobacteria bacterium HGW-Deltaproteobacteria-18]|nr:MAG: DUF533 domain-containing protein [Deltaproteobacteria bacterium HGW-Deltaproteobacteria-18]